MSPGDSASVSYTHLDVYKRQQVERIVEQKDATPDEAAIDEINSCIYAFDVAVLRAALDQVGTDNAQGEKYLTDVVRIARESGHLVRAHVIDLSLIHI